MATLNCLSCLRAVIRLKVSFVFKAKTKILGKFRVFPETSRARQKGFLVSLQLPFLSASHALVLIVCSSYSQSLAFLFYFLLSTSFSLCFSSRLLTVFILLFRRTFKAIVSSDGLA
jgi:hypothetical protein